MRSRWTAPVAMAAALAAGAGTAVLASGAGSGPMITLGDNPGEALTVYGSGGEETITYGGYTEGITVAADRTITSLRADCDVESTFMTSAFCDRNGGYSTIDTRLADGPDSLSFYDSFDAPGFRIIGSGGRGGDSLSGAEKKDEFKGGRGGDQLVGLEGNDNLDGGSGIDVCDGGPGTDRRDNCEG